MVLVLACRVTGGLAILKGVLALLARAPAVAMSVYPAFTRAIERSLKVATPLTARTTVFPERDAMGGLAGSATVTLSWNSVARLPKESCAATWTGGVIAAPCTV